MIIILFPVGSFGSTIEYSLRQFSNELTTVSATVSEDGSMHSYKKEFHPLTLLEFAKTKHNNYEIVTPVYPGNDYLSPIESIKLFKDATTDSQKILLIHFPTFAMAERNLLFAYHKTTTFVLDTVNPTSWNPNYQSYKDMQKYELREALSFYLDHQEEHLKIHTIADEDWLCITPDDILYNFKNTILNIMEYFNLTVDPLQNIDKFYAQWFQKQQYILEEFKLIDSICYNLITKQDMSWNQLSIMGEALIQGRLRRKGVEIACYNLNQFPTDIQRLTQILITEENNEY